MEQALFEKISKEIAKNDAAKKVLTLKDIIETNNTI
tara:strand:- start:1914 stop:2021 length:108 start_codon:yes stop_codon:yes gene_type:complete